MNGTDQSIKITLRMPGNWSHPGELIERLPSDCRLTPHALVLPDGAEIEFTPMPPDDQFAQIFRTSCRRSATDDELGIVGSYTANVCLTGPGGSMESARRMLQAGAAIVRAGAAGVFIDNSALAHGGQHWVEMAKDGGPDALSFAYAGIVSGEERVWTMGMHVMGLPDIEMKRSDVDPDRETIIEVIRYLCRGEKTMGDGHLLADEDGPRFQVQAQISQEPDPGSPMYNPFGRLRLVSMRDIAEGN